ncbi:uncharacterized protein LOC124160966 isoform X2 [Ischnura elegans]|uniref:uncharacterized protein LOC124160966 isoform X2 n=1 Tax=Ischnura elegans TaxID=197161 RepID=UPI001ED8871A|nr:uncharacterized protein LOC124160966 isoform X2 [Ischnura elegans]
MDDCSKILSTRKIWEDGPLNTTAVVNTVRSLLYHQKLTDILKEVPSSSNKNEKKYPTLAEEYKLKPTNQIIEAITAFITEKADLQGCKVEHVSTLSCLNTLKNVLCDRKKVAQRRGVSIAMLSEENRELIKALVTVIHKLYHSDKFDLRSFAKVYLQMEDMPLEILWMFHEASLIDSISYVVKNLSHPAEISRLTSSMSALICFGGEDEVSKKVCIGLLSPLVAVVYGPSTDTASSDLLASHKQALKIVLSSILRKVNEQLLSSPLKNEVSGSNFLNDGELNLNPVDVFHLIALQPGVGGHQSPIIVGFLSNQLADLLTFSPDTTLNQAFTYQSEWSYCKIPQHLQQMLASILRPFAAKNALDIIRTILKMGEVNWRNVLACISVFSVTKDESGMLMKDFVSSLVYEAFSDGCRETLILALLTARQCSLEDCGFPSYAEWFDSMFGVRGTWGKLGDQKGTPSNRNFRLLLSLMTDLVPVESIVGLRAHIAHPPQVPASATSRTVLSDYLHLARTRLSDFGVRTSEQGGLFRTSQLTMNDAIGQKQNLAAAEVEFVLTHFERTGEILRTVLEASVFRKRYLEQTFLPELLKPRVLPEEPDTRMKVIQILASKSLISAAMLKDYNDLCEEEQTKPVNDPGLPSDVPDCLSSLTMELQKHVQLVKRVKSEEFATSSKQMWKNLKESLSAVNQSLQKVSVSFMVDSSDGVSFEGKERKVFDSLALVDCKNPSQNEQVISVFLDTWTRGLTYFSTAEKIQWLQLMLGILPQNLMFTLYQRLYLLFKKPTSELDHGKLDLAASIALCLHIGASEFPDVLLSSQEELDGSQEDMMSERKIVSILDFLSLALPIGSKDEMEHTLVLCETFLNCVDNLFPSFEEVESEREIVSNIPQLFISKYLFLFKRYQFADVNHIPNFKHSLSKNVEVWQKIFCKSQVLLKQWLYWELSINSILDIFTSIASKKDYLLHCLLNFCSKSPVCNVLAIINETFTAIASTWSSEANVLSESSSNFLMLLSFQEFIVYMLDCVMCSSSVGHNAEMPWLLSHWVDLKREGCASSLLEQKENADWVLLRIVNTLPTYLIIKNESKMKDSDIVKDTIVILINKHLRENLCERGFLPLSFMMYLLGGIIDFHSEPEATLNYLIRMCPTFKMALIAHHIQLHPKLQKLKDSPHLKDLQMIRKVMDIDAESETKIPLATQLADWEVALSLWAKKKAKFPPALVVTDEKIVNAVPGNISQWIIYFDMLSLGWNELFRGKYVIASELRLISELMLQRPSLAKSLDAFHLAKQSMSGPHDHCPKSAILSVAHFTCKVLISLLSQNQPGDQLASWMTLLRAVLSARIQWATYAEKYNLRFELETDRDLRSIISQVLGIITSKNMSLSEYIPSVYLSGLDKTITKGILIP